MSLVLYFLSFLLDLRLGDPPHWPHPVRWIGKAIGYGEKCIRAVCPGRAGLIIGGAVLWGLIVGGTWLLSWTLIKWLSRIHPALAMVAQIWLAFTVLASRCLKEGAAEVLEPLRRGDIEAARAKLSWIVGRDTSELDSEAITRATVETVAENTVDGVIAPMFYLFIGGVPLALAYKAVNTLDSMLGYRNERYEALGKVSARMDDLANLLPARLSWLVFALAAWLLNYDVRSTLRIGWRDRYQHKSPNSAWPEASVAGALGIRLGGPSRYAGQWVNKPWIGEAVRKAEPEDILRVNRLMLCAAWISFILFALISGLLFY